MVVCYDAHASPIRDMQRCGRTGRHRNGRVVQLLALGKEEASYERQQMVDPRLFHLPVTALSLPNCLLQGHFTALVLGAWASVQIVSHQIV